MLVRLAGGILGAATSLWSEKPAGSAKTRMEFPGRGWNPLNSVTFSGLFLRKVIHCRILWVLRAGSGLTSGSAVADDLA